tara:strand:- start:1 stop:108 length:108 start_codon:yes stop_codon:yes gene_type:complete
MKKRVRIMTTLKKIMEKWSKKWSNFKKYFKKIVGA